jgi:hypothetical protein
MVTLWDRFGTLTTGALDENIDPAIMEPDAADEAELEVWEDWDEEVVMPNKRWMEIGSTMALIP